MTNSDLFASVPDRCPKCGKALDTEAELTRHDDDRITGTVTTTCHGCGYEDAMTVSGDSL